MGNVKIGEVNPTQVDLDQYSPENMIDSVVFKGDGEPRSAANTLKYLSEMAIEGVVDQDYYTLGGVVSALELEFAERLATESAIFMPTGTLANHLAVRKHCGLNSRAIVQEQGHIYNDTGDSISRLSSINLIPLGKDVPFYGLTDLKEQINRSNGGRVPVNIGAVVIESPVRRKYGQIMPYEEMKEITAYCKEVGIPTHLDGARLYMMAAATGINPKSYVGLFDSVYVSLYKYFGAPYGAILAGKAEFIEGLYEDRRMFGGGLMSSYVAAALALRGVGIFEENFSQAMAKSKTLFKQLNNLDGMSVKGLENGSTIFRLEMSECVDLDEFITHMRNDKIFLYRDETNPEYIFITVNTTLLRQTNVDIYKSFEKALFHSKT